MKEAKTGESVARSLRDEQVFAVFREAAKKLTEYSEKGHNFTARKAFKGFAIRVDIHPSVFPPWVHSMQTDNENLTEGK